VSPAVATESARKVCARLHQAYRDRRLYPAGHPSAQSTIEALATIVRSHLDAHGALTLQVMEDSLSLAGEQVYSLSETRDNLAFLMFRDGIRSVTVSAGIELNEVEDLVDCLARADQLQDTDHDLSTALWEKDLVHVALEVVDPFLEGEGARDDAFEELRETVRRRLEELGSVDTAEAEARGADSREADPGTVGRGLTAEEHGKIDQEAIALTEEEVARGEWLASHPSDPLDEFVVVLMEIISSPAGLAGDDAAVIDSLSSVLGHYLDACNLDGLDAVLAQMAAFEEEGRMPQGSSGGIFGQAATAERLDRLITAAVEGPPEQVERVENLLCGLQDAIHPTLLETLAASDDRTVRKTVLDVLRLGGGVPLRHIWPLMEDPRWYVVRNALQLATASEDPEVIDRVERLTRHLDSRVRREALRSLITLGGARNLSDFTRALRDEDSGVRTLAARGLASYGTSGQAPAVQAQVQAKDLDTRPTEEIEAILSTYVVLGGDEAVEAVNRIWKRKVFGSRPMPVRLAAVAALGAVSTPASRQALVEASSCREAQLERAAARAVSDAQARERGAGA